MTLSDLEMELVARGVVCASFRPPCSEYPDWRVNYRTDGTHWKCGAPAPTLAEAMVNAFPDLGRVDEMDDLIG